MSDFIFPQPEPNETNEKVSTEPGILSSEAGLKGRRAGGDERGDTVSEAIAALLDLTSAGVEVDGELQIAESTWAIYGRTSYDGEIIVGEYHDAAEASEVLRAATHPRSDPDSPIP